MIINLSAIILHQVNIFERDESNELLGKIQGLSGDPKLRTQLVGIAKQRDQTSKAKRSKSEGRSIGI